MIPMFPCLALLFLALLPPVAVSTAIPQTLSQRGAKPVIVSTQRPRDSLGETVYARQGDEDKGATIVPGLLNDPTPLHTPKPKYSEAMKKAKYRGDVTVEGVITQAGDVIDIKVEQPADPEAAQAALAAVSQYRFKPPTLDGKPVAMRLRVVVNFRIW